MLKRLVKKNWNSLSKKNDDANDLDIAMEFDPSLQLGTRLKCT